MAGWEAFIDLNYITELSVSWAPLAYDGFLGKPALREPHYFGKAWDDHSRTREQVLEELNASARKAHVLGRSLSMPVNSQPVTWRHNPRSDNSEKGSALTTDGSFRLAVTEYDRNMSHGGNMEVWRAIFTEFGREGFGLQFGRTVSRDQAERCLSIEALGNLANLSAGDALYFPANTPDETFVTRIWQIDRWCADIASIWSWPTGDGQGLRFQSCVQQLHFLAGMATEARYRLHRFPEA